MRKLGRTTAQRKAMLRGMVTLLLKTGKVETTYARAQELSAKADEMITLGKKGGLSAYRAALEYITEEDVAKKLFDVIAPAYAEVNGGYTKVLKMGPRRGDGAETAIVKLVEVKAKDEAPAVVAPVEEKPVEETPVEETPVEETPVEETPAEETPAEETPAEETPAEE